MALVSYFESTTQTIGATEFSFPSDSTVRVAQTAVGTFFVYIDLTNLVAGDQFEFIMYEKIGGSGATQRAIYRETKTSGQTISISWGPVGLRNGWDVTGRRLTGSDRVLPISIFRVNDDVNVATISNNAITASAIATDAVDADALSASALSEIAVSVMASVIETGFSLTQSMRLLLSSAVAKVSGFSTNSPVFRDIGDTKNRITATTTSDGRTSVTVDAT